jgi:hypothetical protein
MWLAKQAEKDWRTRRLRLGNQSAKVRKGFLTLLGEEITAPAKIIRLVTTFASLKSYGIHVIPLGDGKVEFSTNIHIFSGDLVGGLISIPIGNGIRAGPLTWITESTDPISRPANTEVVADADGTWRLRATTGIYFLNDIVPASSSPVQST